jgi:hypothetical protein
MTHRLSTATVLAVIAGSMLACSDDNPIKTADAGADGSVSDGGAADAQVVDAREAGPVLLAAIRVAHFSPDAPPIDVCLTPRGSSFTGSPLLASQFSAADAGGVENGGTPTGLSFPQVSAYINVPAGQYDVRLVAAGSTDCSAAIGSDLLGVSPIVFNTFNTLAILGELSPSAGAPSLRAVVFPDDTTAPSSADPSAPFVGIRFINAAPNVPSAELGAYDTPNGSASYGADVTGVAFGSTSAGSSVADRNGYIRVVPAIAGYDLSVRASDDYAGLNQVVTSAFEFVAGGAAGTIALVAPVPLAVVDAGALSDGSDEDAGSPPGADAGTSYVPVGSVVVCIDNAIVMLDPSTPSPLACCVACVAAGNPFTSCNFAACNAAP